MFATLATKQKKADVVKCPEANNHVGILINGPVAAATCPSSSHPTFNFDFQRIIGPPKWKAIIKSADFGYWAATRGEGARQSHCSFRPGRRHRRERRERAGRRPGWHGWSLHPSP